jgi:hypothetical protein
MATNDRKDTRSGENRDAERGDERRETGMEYGANETEQTRERERAPYDKTDEVGEITETELP